MKPGAVFIALYFCLGSSRNRSCSAMLLRLADPACYSCSVLTGMRIYCVDTELDSCLRRNNNRGGGNLMFPFCSCKDNFITGFLPAQE